MTDLTPQRRSAMRIDAALLGTNVKRVAQPAPHVLALELASREVHGVLLIGLSPGARGLGWQDGRLPGSGPNAWLLKWKKTLVGGSVVQVIARDDQLRIEVRRAERSAVVEATFRTQRAELRLCDGSGTLIAELRSDGAVERARSGQDPIALGADVPELDALRHSAQNIVRGGDADHLEAERIWLARSLRRSTERARRKLLAIEGDLQRAMDVPRLRRDAGLVLSWLHTLPRDSKHATLLDATRDPPEPVALTFAPELGPQLQAEAWFRRARRLERGAVIAQERAQAARDSIAKVEVLAASLAVASSRAEFDACRDQAVRLGVDLGTRPEQAGREHKPERLPYREFRSSGDRAIWVGRGARDNDRLTLHHAKPHDLWLHTRDAAGAHVVVPLTRTETCPPELLVDAATLAAHFSRERGQTLVDVLYTPRRYLRKPRKSEPGQVIPSREKVLRLRLEAARLQRLLGSERAPGDRARDKS